MTDAVLYLAGSFWLGAVHAATPGHGKTIAAAYIVGARGRPADAFVLGVFVTLSHTVGIVLVAVLAAMGAAWAVPARVEAYLAVVTGLLVVGIGVWMLRGQWAALALPGHGHGHAPHRSRGPRACPRGHEHDTSTRPSRATCTRRRRSTRSPHGHAHDPALGYHRHGFGPAHTHRLDLLTEGRPSWAILLGLGVAGGLLPDPGALAILLAALASGKVVLGLFTVLVFSLGFASVLVLVGLIAARVGQIVLTWLESRWILWLQLGTGLVILTVGLLLTVKAGRTLAALG